MHTCFIIHDDPTIILSQAKHIIRYVFDRNRKFHYVCYPISSSYSLDNITIYKIYYAAICVILTI